MSRLQIRFTPDCVGLSWTDPDIFTLMLTQSLIGTFDAKRGGAPFSSAKLVSELSKLDCGVQLLQPFCTCYNDTGLFGVYFTASMAKKEQVDDLFSTIQEEVRAKKFIPRALPPKHARLLCILIVGVVRFVQLVALTTGTPEDDLEMAKKQLKYNLLLQMDGTSANAEEIGRHMLAYGRRISLAETFARIDAIEASDVQRVTEKIIWDQEVAFAGMGPNLKYVFDINGLRRGTYWNRL